MITISSHLWLTDTALRDFLNSFSAIEKDDIYHQQKPNPHENLSVIGGHWEYSAQKIPPYNYSDEVCQQTFLHPGDCKNVANCADHLMNWQYVTRDDTPYPAFDVDGFRTSMKHKQLLFLGDSTMRQQVQALVWSLGFKKIDWKKEERGKWRDKQCAIDPIGNITICRQFMGTMATQVYHEGNYTFNLTEVSGHGDTSHLLQDEMIDEIAEFDLVFIQGVAWFAGMQRTFDSPTSPSEWLWELIPKLYRDVMESLLRKLSHRTKTILVLGQSGTACRNKTDPEPFYPDRIPGLYSWNIIPQLWNQSLNVIKELSLNVQVVDAREPLMQSVHAHPVPDCLHFCTTSAALNMYLDMYWYEVFRHVKG